jgi:hypothetical protein
MPGDPGPGRVEELASHNRITLQENRKAARVSGLFAFISLLSGYQVQPKNRPNIFEGIVVEVVWNEGALLW